MSFRNKYKTKPFASFSVLFRSGCKCTLYFLTMYVYCVCPAMSSSIPQKKQKKQLNCRKRTETSAYTATVSYRSST